MITDAALDALVAREFPRLQSDETIFLNSAATGPLPESTLRVIAAHNELRAEPWRYTPEVQFGGLTRARELAARMVNGSPSEIALTVNTSYGLNLAARALPLAPGDVVVGTDRDFPANVYPWLALEGARGVEFHQVPCNGRLFDEDALLAALDEPRVKALAISWVSFESGARLDLDRLGRACRERDIWFVVDAIQGLGPLTLDVQHTPIDILSCGAQKWLCAPWGSAFTWIRRDLVQQLEPQHVGWMSVKGADDFSQMLDYALDYREDARRFELITLPYQDFAGFNASLEVLHEAGPEAIAARVLTLTTPIVEWALAHRTVRLVTNPDPARRAGTVSLIPPEPEKTSARLTARGMSHSLREGALRISPHFFTPRHHIDLLLRELEASL